MSGMNLRNALWVAQAGACWICREQMLHFDRCKLQHPKRSTLDHVWPKAIFGDIGDVGFTLLAHAACNHSRPCRRPTDDEIRLLISVYRRIDRGPLTRALREARQTICAAEKAIWREQILSELRAA